MAVPNRTDVVQAAKYANVTIGSRRPEPDGAGILPSVA